MLQFWVLFLMLFSVLELHLTRGYKTGNDVFKDLLIHHRLVVTHNKNIYLNETGLSWVIMETLNSPFPGWRSLLDLLFTHLRENCTDARSYHPNYCDLRHEYCDKAINYHCSSCADLCQPFRMSDDRVKRKCAESCSVYVLYQQVEKQIKLHQKINYTTSGDIVCEKDGGFWKILILLALLPTVISVSVVTAFTYRLRQRGIRCTDLLLGRTEPQPHYDAIYNRRGSIVRVELENRQNERNQAAEVQQAAENRLVEGQGKVQVTATDCRRSSSHPADCADVSSGVSTTSSDRTCHSPAGQQRKGRRKGMKNNKVGTNVTEKEIKSNKGRRNKIGTANSGATDAETTNIGATYAGVAESGAINVEATEGGNVVFYRRACDQRIQPPCDVSRVYDKDTQSA